MAGNNSSTFQNFKDAYCAHYGCKPANFVRNIFFRSLPPTHRPLGWLAWVVNRDLFGVDLDQMEHLGKASSGREASGVMGELEGMRRVERSFWRGVVGLRSNSRRLNNIWRRIEYSIERPELAPEQRASKISGNAFAPGDSHGLIIRRLRQAHTDIVNGQPLEQVLGGLRMTYDVFMKHIADHSASNPGFAWLRERLLRDEKLRKLEEENANLGRTVSSLAVELQSLRGTADARPKVDA